MSVINAALREGARQPSSRDSSYISIRGNDNLSLKALYISVGIPSGPAVLPLFIFTVVFKTSLLFRGSSSCLLASLLIEEILRLSKNKVCYILRPADSAVYNNWKNLEKVLLISTGSDVRLPAVV